ncbi:MAG: hypothetical protein INH43_25455 [Acidobacteriaceae bacterium]|nr:hypothetical protein [Acidobacteriaceae bacterium]
MIKEAQWFWRRLFTFLFTGVNSLAVATIVWKIDDPGALKWIGLGLIFANIMLAFVYMAGATLVDLTRLKSEAIKTAEEVKEIIT